MKLSRRGLILGGAATLAACATSGRQDSLQIAQVSPAELPPVTTPLEVIVTEPARPAMDIAGQIRKPLLDQALAALERHGSRIPNRDAMFIVDFDRHSAQPRLYRLNLGDGRVDLFRTAHGKGSDPAHTGFAQRFSNTPESHASSVGAFVTAGMSSGAVYSENVLLDGLDGTNYLARERAIIVHAADYCEPAYVARHGKMGRSNGCFSLSGQDLRVLRPAMDRGRLLFAGA